MKTVRLYIHLIIVAVAAMLLSSCATLFTGTRDKISFNTDPPGAIVYINGIEQGVTPCKVDVKRSINDTEVVFRLDGYQTRFITLSKEFNLVSILNLENLFGWGIDVLTGAIVKYDQKRYNLTLQEEGVYSSLNPTKVEIDTRNQTVDVYVME